ncbi:unnamed protein product [Eruca vesicaria subsp. sativa]|uniref:Uncharacterized protein n=1 Tax=Eruca vesicaria subsp. sativa TaxID=29727 RepID=A0ABC8KHC9_ERUVS|nr:unnamed protein product [Eruca vesicaria subsp. sativa]
MASVQYGIDQGMEIFNNELMIMSFLEEESPVNNLSSTNEEEEKELNRVIRSLEVEINTSSSSPIESRDNDLQQTKSGLEDDFGWLNDFDIGVVMSQIDNEMMNWCTEFSCIDGVDGSGLEIEGGDYYSHINYGLTFEEPTLSLWQENNDVFMY